MNSLSWLPVLVLLAASPAAAALEITACGQVVPPASVAVLQGDLFCEADGETPAAVRLGNGASLDLQGRSLGVSGMDAVRCDDSNPASRCSVLSTGTAGLIAGDTGRGIAAYNLEVTNVVVMGFEVGLAGPNQGMGGRELRATNVALQQNATATSFWGNAWIDGSTISDNGAGIAVLHGAEVKDSIIADNHNTGVRTDGSLRAENVSISGNTNYGVHAFGRAVLIDSTVVGSEASASYRDILSNQSPVLVNSSCEKSGGAGSPSASWGVCSLD